MTVFWTIVTGAAVFVISQYLLKIVIEPSIVLKRAIAEMASELLFHQAKITNNIDPEGGISETLKKFSSRLQSGSYVLPVYSISRWVFCLPRQDDIQSACRQLNLIANNLQTGDMEKRSSLSEKNYDALEKIEKHLGVKTRYS